MKATVKFSIGAVALLIGAAAVWIVALGMSALLPTLMSMAREGVYMLYASSALSIAVTSFFALQRKLKKRDFRGQVKRSYRL